MKEFAKIYEEISGIKIGLQYITQNSTKEIKELSKFNKPIFYDGKFFDIKNTSSPALIVVWPVGTID